MRVALLGLAVVLSAYQVLAMLYGVACVFYGDPLYIELPLP